MNSTCAIWIQWSFKHDDETQCNTGERAVVTYSVEGSIHCMACGSGRSAFCGGVMPVYTTVICVSAPAADIAFATRCGNMDISRKRYSAAQKS